MPKAKASAVDRVLAELKAHVDAKYRKGSMMALGVTNGTYGKDDVVLGVRVPHTRALVQEHLKRGDLSLSDVEAILHSEVHEMRLFALIWLTKQKVTDELVTFYLANSSHINNWDLVDVSAHLILGRYLLEVAPDKRAEIKKRLLAGILWDRRIMMVSMLYFARHNELDFPYEVAGDLLGDSHHLIQKATGWVLRELGKRDETRLRAFLSANRDRMSKITFSYATERIKLD